MTALTPHWNTFFLTLPLLAALCYAVVACLPAGNSPEAARALWRRAHAAAASALAIALLAAGGWAAGAHGVLSIGSAVPLGSWGALGLSLRLDVLSVAMQVLVSFIGLVILHYSRRQLDGDAGQRRYVRAYMATLAAVLLLVSTNNLLLLALAWVAVSLALHRLLTHFSDRPQALIAAHKKFIASRVADACLLVAVGLIGSQVGSLEMDALFTRVAAPGGLTPALQAAAVLAAIAAALKCAQLPFHGWLIQVMEAPTAVSALLHAGVVNMGGFLMIRLAPLMAPAASAQTLLVVIGTVTAVVAALVMSTRVSIKVMLAWSTCAQMGFMLLECGLGAYPLALLHLLAHSLYKAHAFLSCGSVVEQWRTQAQARKLAPVGFGVWLVALAVTPLAVGGAAWLLGVHAARDPALLALAVVMSVALTPLVARGLTSGGRQALGLFALSAALSAVYFAWHGVFAQLLPTPAASADLWPRVVIVIAGFAALYLLHAAIAARPNGRWAQALQPHLFAGLYLDDLFTRATFRLWPARLPQAAPLRNTAYASTRA
ncbi:MAG: NADH-quinone oxidoreductase subunit L [Betaproteobacteria bacterium]|nr:NADH-quinone oxidoreductase subunit L [Betaproteobacteria bacterium]